LWEQNVIEVVQDWYMLSFSAKELGSKKTTVRTLADYPGFKRDHKNDKALVQDLWRVLDEADVVIAHNGNAFDLKKAAARFIYHGLKPPSPSKKIDTLKIARSIAKFSSNKLDDLGRDLGVGRKLKHPGKKLWIDCVNGVESAFRLMGRYNRQDVELLERVFLKLRPYATNLPNLTFYTRQHDACPSCQSPNTTHRGWNYSRTGKRRRIQCQDCGAWSATGNLVREK
jgi:DNA polymerase elongation subunit (family B)